MAGKPSQGCAPARAEDYNPPGVPDQDMGPGWLALWQRRPRVP